MTFEQLLYVQVLSSHHSLQKAADALHISKSGLSTAISQLEEELNLKIFERDAKGTRLSVDGKRLLSEINAILRSKNELETTVYHLTHADHTAIHIHYQNTLFKPLITIFMNHYETEYKNISLNISCHELESIIESVETQKIDAGMIAINNTTSAKLNHLIFRPICHAELKLLCSKDNDLYKRKLPLTIDALKQQRFCIFNDSSHDDIFDRLQAQCGPLKLVLRTDDGWAMNQAITRLNCVSFGRDIQGRFSSDDRLMKDVAMLSLNSLIDDHFSIGWLLNPNHHLSPLTKQYLDGITNAIKKEADQ